MVGGTCSTGAASACMCICRGTGATGAAYGECWVASAGCSGGRAKGAWEAQEGAGDDTGELVAKFSSPETERVTYLQVNERTREGPQRGEGSSRVRDAVHIEHFDS